MIRAIRRAWYAIGWRLRRRRRKRNAAGERCDGVPRHDGPCAFASERPAPSDAELIILASGLDVLEAPWMWNRIDLRPDGRSRVKHLRRQMLAGAILMFLPEGLAPLPPGAREL